MDPPAEPPAATRGLAGVEPVLGRVVTQPGGGGQGVVVGVEGGGSRSSSSNASGNPLMSISERTRYSIEATTYPARA